MEFRDTFSGPRGEIRDVYVSLLYTPIIHDGKRIGVLELYADACPIFERINENSVRIAAIVFAIFSALYLTLFFAVFRTDRAMLKWQKALADSARSLKESQLIAGLGTYDLDVATGKLITSDILEQLLGVDKTYPHTLEGWASLLHPDDRAMMIEYLNNEVLAKGQPFNKEYRIIRPNDRSERWVHGLGKMEFDSAGNPLTMHGTVQDITRQKEIQLRSQNAESRYKAVMLNSVDALYVCDLNGNFVEVSQQACTQLGYSHDELLQSNVKDILPELDLAARAPAWRALEPGQPFKIIGQFRRKDGSTFPVEVHLAALLINDEKFMMGLASDITERKQAEEMAALNRNIIDKSSDGFYRHDLDGYLQDVNQAYADMMGYTREELIGMNIFQLSLTANTPNLIWERIHKTMREGSLRFETRHRSKSGKVIDFSLSAIALPESKCIYAFLRDISEQKLSEEALRIAAVAFETHEAILITDADSRIVRVNHAFCEITGYNAFEVMGKNPRIMSSGRHDRPFYIEMWQQLLHEGSWSGEIWDKRKNGQIYPKWLNITAVKNTRHETTHYVAIFSDITERKKTEDQIHHLAFYDALTKLPNRRLFLDRLQTALNASARRNDHGAILFIDLDRFKVLNDTHGHEYGDLLLIEVGVRLKACVREMDTVARFGGDEFVVLLEAASNDKEDAIRKTSLVAEKIRAALATPYKLKEHEHHCSPSIGVSMYHGNDETIEMLLEHADMAMYQVKGCGRNAVSFFDPVMQHNVTMRESLENDLYHAIDLKQLHLHYQVQVDKDNHPVGAEAFLRWIHPERGTIMPNQFLAIAEDSTLILDIGRWVLRTACMQLASWSNNERTRKLVLTVNISAKHFEHPDFVREVAQTLHQHQIDPSRLKLELSEKIVLADSNDSMAKIQALRELGIKLSMDNFATMYSSLSYLKQLSQDQLKIHQEFVQGISSGGNDAELIRTVVSLAKSLDLDVFAEGVETEEQLDFLMAQECNAYQGYLIGKPVPIEDFDSFLKGL
jgi:diguanylate cyclase (GGDEF)-like protein/PAS domain S-box-containing protein